MLHPAGVDARPDKQPHACPGAVRGIVFYRAATWRWQSQHDAPRTRSSYAERRVHGCGYLRWSARLWQHRAMVERRAFEAWYVRMLGADGVSGKWGCIHRHEGSWTDPNAPHFGGLQMDYGFMRTYGSEFLARWGTADRWPPWAQVLAAERAYHGYAGYGGRGFGPWTTRTVCGV